MSLKFFKLLVSFTFFLTFSGEKLFNVLPDRSNLHVFTLKELQMITHNFSRSDYLGEGGFGKVYKGCVDDNLRPGLKAQTVAVKVLDVNGSQGHREWLVTGF